MKFALGAAVAAALTASGAHAVVVADSLPFAGTSSWSDHTVSGTSMVVSGGESVLSTANVRGVWFGWHAGTNPPAWTIATNAQGNYLSLTTKFDAGSDDWSAYLRDGARDATMLFNKTDCTATLSISCYGVNGTPGVTLRFAGAAPGTFSTQFVAIDTTQYVTYEFLLLGDNVTYRINGVSYSGTAATSAAEVQLVIGDGSGGTLNGTGKMRISALSFDRAPAFTSLPSLVPEPGSWAMLIAGFGLTGAAMRRRRMRIA
jgi:hypothetical protein